jgi:hypothetical protein
MEILLFATIVLLLGYLAYKDWLSNKQFKTFIQAVTDQIVEVEDEAHIPADRLHPTEVGHPNYEVSDQNPNFPDRLVDLADVPNPFLNGLDTPPTVASIRDRRDDTFQSSTVFEEVNA